MRKVFCDKCGQECQGTEKFRNGNWGFSVRGIRMTNCGEVPADLCRKCFEEAFKEAIRMVSDRNAKSSFLNELNLEESGLRSAK